MNKISGIDPELLYAAGQGDAEAFKACEEIMLSAMAWRADTQKPSMAQDIGKGMKTEIDFINGMVVRTGEKHGIPTPANAGIVEVVKRIEAGEIQPSPKAVAGL